MNKINKFLRKKKNYIVFLLVFSFAVSLPYAAELVWATSASDKKNQAQSELDKLEDEMEDIESQKDQVDAELEDVRAQLSSLIAQQEALAVEIETTQTDLDQTAIDLEIARAEAQAQYEAMVIRIQYMYENASSDSIWTAILEADGITDFLNRVEYISTIYETDRTLTEQYKATVAEVELKEQELLVKRDDLLMKQEAFLGQQYEIEMMIAELEDVQAEYATELAAAEAQAASYRNTIAEQDKIIQQQQSGSSGGGKEYTGGQDVSGEEVVNYALQFVGYPYVWGGKTSLTGGVDCSGFVHLVYKNFGYKTVSYSMHFLNEGRAVSVDEIMPGDIVVYERSSSGIGHVAIYIGNGKIVEAQSTAAGITSNRNLHCRGIIGVRRILPNP